MGPKVFSGHAVWILRHHFRGALSNDFPASIPSLGAHIDDPVGSFDDVQIMFDDNDRIALVAQAMENFEEEFDVVKVQSGGGFVQNVERAPCIPLGQFKRQFDTLSFAAGKSGCGLAQSDVTQSYIQKSL